MAPDKNGRNPGMPDAIKERTSKNTNAFFQTTGIAKKCLQDKAKVSHMSDFGLL